MPRSLKPGCLPSGSGSGKGRICFGNSSGRTPAGDFVGGTAAGSAAGSQDDGLKRHAVIAIVNARKWDIMSLLQA